MNVLLFLQIERLEDERLEMKQSMRKLSQKLGQRCVRFILQTLYSEMHFWLKGGRAGFASGGYDGFGAVRRRAKVGKEESNGAVAGYAAGTAESGRFLKL